MTPEALVLPSPPPIITAGYVMQVIFSLLVILASIYLAGRYILPRFKAQGSGRMIEVLDRVYLEPQVAAYIVKVGKSAWLLAVGRQNIVKVDKIEDESIIGKC